MHTLFRFCITFSETWIISYRENPMLPPEEILQKLEQTFTVTKSSSSISECSGILDSNGLDADAVTQTISAMIRKTFNLSDTDGIVELFLSEDTEETEIPQTESEQHCKQKSEKQSSVADKMNIINHFVGAEDFKKLANECNNIAERLRNNQVVDTFTSRSYVISINDGYGLTSYLNAFADLIEAQQLLTLSSTTKVVETALDPPDSRSDHEEFNAVEKYFQGRGKGKVICIDISEWMANLTDKPFRDFLKRIDKHIGEHIVFFRVPFVERNIVTDIKNSIGDILSVTELSIPPFTNDELIQCATFILSERGYEADADIWEVFSARVAAEKSDGRFYGLNTVNKIIREMLYTKQLHDLANGVNDKIIHKDDIRSIVDSNAISSKSGFAQLGELVGMESIQARVTEVIAQIEASISNHALDAPCIHMRFVGNPGTGKTTVARIIGTILKEKGILRNGSFFEHSGRDLCGRFVGETAPKTAAICRDAYGSVLFIDEAYSLYRDDGISNADYGREAIDTLVAEMENHRTDLMVIMAGYPGEMEKLMTGNVGLRSRMPYLIEFPNYTKEQLAEIFFSMARKGFRFDNEFSEAVRTYFITLSEDIIGAKDFSNARFVRNLFERTWGKAALRCQMNSLPCDTLKVEDFVLATSDKEFLSLMDQKKRAIGFY